MLKNFLRLTAGLALIILSQEAKAEGKQFSNNNISATSTNTAVPFIAVGDVNAFVAKKIVVCNTLTVNEVYVSWDTQVSTTTKGFYLAPASSATFPNCVTIWAEPGEPGWTGIGLICSAAETTTVRVTAIRVNP